jgi:ParB family chromosome partitioning protein
MKAELVPLERIIPDPFNPRTDFPEEQKRQLVESIRLHGVKVPGIGYTVGNGIMLGDGHFRLEAAREAGLKEMPVIVFQHKPDEAELLATQLTINGHRLALNPMDERDAFLRLMKLKVWSPKDLATGLAISPSEVTRVLSLSKLSPDEQQLVREGKITKSAAYALSRMPAEERASLVEKAASGEITRDQLNARARKKDKSESVKTRRVSCALAGRKVSVQAEQGINLGGLIELLEQLLKSFRKARSQGLDVATAVQILKDQNRGQDALSSGATT